MEEALDLSFDRLLMMMMMTLEKSKSQLLAISRLRDAAYVNKLFTRKMCYILNYDTHVMATVPVHKYNTEVNDGN